MSIKERFNFIKIAMLISVSIACISIISMIIMSYFHICRKQDAYPIFIIATLLFMIFSFISIIVASREMISVGKRLTTAQMAIVQNIDRLISSNYEDVKDESISDSIELENILSIIKNLGEKMENDERYERENAAFIRESIANISHDVKTPLSSIRGSAEALIDNIADTDEKRDQYARIIINKVGTISTLLSELSYYSSIDTDGVLDVILPVSVKEYFDDCADEISPELQLKHINFTYINSVENDVFFCIDVQKISKAVKNIINNSIKYVDYDEGVIMLKVEDIGENISVTIQDNGHGVPEDKLSHIFERYYKADSARGSQRSGSGIGLSIVKKIIEDHGGKVSAMSKEGSGTIINFTLRKYEGEV